MSDLKTELKQLIINTLNLVDITPDKIIDDQPLFVEGLGLDSIDALELVVALDFNYGVKIEDMETGKAAFSSINALSDFVGKNRQK